MAVAVTSVDSDDAAPADLGPSMWGMGAGGLSAFDRQKKAVFDAAVEAFNPEREDHFVHSPALLASLATMAPDAAQAFAADLSGAAAMLALGAAPPALRGALESAAASVTALQFLAGPARHAYAIRATALVRSTAPAVLLGSRAFSLAAGHAPSSSSCQGRAAGAGGALERVACLAAIARAEVASHAQWRREAAAAEGAGAGAAAAAIACQEPQRRSLRSSTRRGAGAPVGPPPPPPHLANVIDWLPGNAVGLRGSWESLLE